MFVIKTQSAELIYSFDFVDYTGWNIITETSSEFAIDQLNSTAIECQWDGITNHACAEIIGDVTLINNLSLSGWKSVYLTLD